MAGFEDIRQLIAECHYRIAEDRAALRRLALELSYTDHVIERATLAYHVSLWTLEKVERSQSTSRLNASNPPAPRASPPEPSDSWPSPKAARIGRGGASKKTMREGDQPGRCSSSH